MPTSTLTAPPLSPFPERNTSTDDSPLPRYQLLAPAPPPPPQPPPSQPASQPHLSGLTDEICPPWLLRIIQRDAALRSALATAYKEDRRRQSGE